MKIQQILKILKKSPLYKTVLEKPWLNGLEKFFSLEHAPLTIIGMETHLTNKKPLQTDLFLFFIKENLDKEIQNNGPFRQIAEIFNQPQIPYNGLWLEYDICNGGLVATPSIWLNCQNPAHILSITEQLCLNKALPEQTVGLINDFIVKNPEIPLKGDVGFMLSRKEYAVLLSRTFRSIDNCLEFYKKKHPEIYNFIIQIPQLSENKISFSSNLDLTERSKYVGLECEVLDPISFLNYLAKKTLIEEEHLKAFTQWQQNMKVKDDIIGRISHFKLVLDKTSGNLEEVKIYYGFETLKNFLGSSYFRKKFEPSSS